MAKLNVEVIVGLVNRLTRPLQGIQRDLTRTAARFSMAGMGASMAGGQIIAPLKDAARASMELESAMADVRKVVDFPAPDGLAVLQAQIEDLTKSIPLAAAQLAQIAAAGGQLGIAAPDLKGYVETVAKAATAFDMIPEEAGTAFAKLSNIYAIPIAQIGGLGDAINHLSNNSAAKASEIVDAISRVGGTAKQFGLTAAQASALSATMIGLGKSPEVAATGINALLTKLQTATKQPKKFVDALDSIGVSAKGLEQSIATDAQGALSGFLETLSAVDSQARAGILTDLFGLEYSDDISVLAGNLDAYRKSLGLISSEARYAGSMQAEFAARSDTTANKLQLLGNQAAELQRRIGDALLPVILDVAKQISPIVEKISAWIRANPELTGQIVLVAGALGAVLLVVGPLLMGLAGIMGMLSMGISVFTAVAGAAAFLAPIIAGIGRAFMVLRLVLAANPIGALITLVAGAVWVFTHWEETIAAASDAWGWLIEKLGFDPVQAVIGKWEALTGFFSGLWSDLTASFEAGFLQGMATLLERANPITLMIGLFRTLAPDAYAAIAEVATGVLDRLRTILSIDTLREIGMNLMRGLIDGIKRMAGSAWDAVKSAASGAVDAAKGALGVHSPSLVFAGIGENLMRGLSIGISRLQSQPLADIRTMAGGLARTAGAVAVGGAMMSAPAVAAPARGSVSMPITITINAPAGTDAKALADLVRREVSGATRQASSRIAALYDGSDNL